MLTIWHICHIIIAKGETMPKFEVIFYEEKNGECPIEEFLEELNNA